MLVCFELYTFDANGRHLETRHALTNGLLFSFDYDPEGRLASVTDGDGRATVIVRDAAGNPTAIESPFGHQTQLGLDPNGFLSSIENPANELRTFSYSPSGLLLGQTNARGNSVSYHYDALGQLERTERASTGTSRDYAFAPTPTESGASVTSTTAEGRARVYTTEELSDGEQLRSLLSPAGLLSQSLIDRDGSRVLTRQDGTIVTRLDAPDPRLGMLSPFASSHSVETGGLTRTTTRTRTNTLTDPFDLATLETQTDTVAVNGRSVTTTFDNTGAVPTRTRTTAAGRTTITELDDQGRPTRIEIAGLVGGTTALTPTLMDYDDGSINAAHAGLLRSVTRGSGVSERRFDFFYDAEGNLAQVDAPLGQTTSFTYDAATRVASQTFPDGEVVRFFYDADGNLETLAQPGSPAAFTPADVHTLTSEERSLLSAYTAPDIGLASHTTSHVYSPDGDLDTTTRPDALLIDRDYDSAGRLSSITTPRGIIDYSYFPATDPSAPGKLATIVDNRDAINLDFTYSGTLLTSTVWSGAISGDVVLAYDDDLRVTSDTVSGSAVTYTYADADGLLTQAGALDLQLDPDTALLTGATIGTLTDSIGYNTFAEPVSYTVHDGTSNVYEMTLAYDNLGRITHKTETLSGATVGFEYRYDAASRLEEVHSGPGDCASVACALDESYTYDANGNRLTLTDASGSTNASYDAQDRLISNGATDYFFSAAGELEEKQAPTGTTTYSYDVLGNLREVTLPDGTLIQYLIDGQNRRVGKLVNGAMTQGFLYRDGPGPIAELGPDGTTVVARFVFASKSHVPDFMLNGGSTYRFVTDQLGSVRAVVDVSDGSIVQEIEYDAWGNATLVTGTWDVQPFGFAGGLYDELTGLVRFGSRDYDAEIGRWTSKDPLRFLSGETNLYTYSELDPVNKIDPAGQASAAAAAIPYAGPVIHAGLLIIGTIKEKQRRDCDIKYHGTYSPLVPSFLLGSGEACKARARQLYGEDNAAPRCEVWSETKIKEVCDECYQECLANISWNPLNDPWPAGCP